MRVQVDEVEGVSEARDMDGELVATMKRPGAPWRIMEEGDNLKVNRDFTVTKMKPL